MDAPQRLRGSAQPDPEAAGHDRVPGRDPDGRQRRAGAGAAPVRDRQPRLGRHHADGARRADCGSACGSSKTNASGHREDLRLLAARFARAVDRLCTAEEPAAADRVVPISPHQVNHRVQVLAEASRASRRTPDAGAWRRSSSAAAPRRPPSRPPGGWQSAAMVARYSGYRPDSCRITR